MAEYDKTIQGFYTSTGAAKTLVLPFEPDWIELKVQGSAGGDSWTNSTSTSLVKEAYWYNGMANDTALATSNTVSAATDTKAFVASGGFYSFTSDPNLFGPVKTGTAITAANPAVATVNGHGYAAGDTVLLYGTTGMLQIAGLPFTLGTVASNTFQLAYLNASGFGAAATAVKAKKIIYPNVYIPQLRYITAVTTGSTTTIQFSTTHGYVVGQLIRFHCGPECGMIQLDGKQGQVLSVNTGTNTIVVDIDSTSFTAFAFPTSTVAAEAYTFPHACPIGEIATVFNGAFVDNGSRGVVLGTNIVGPNGALVLWKAGLSLKTYTS